MDIRHPIKVKLMPDAAMELPYDGAKEMILVDAVDLHSNVVEKRETDN